MVEQNGGKFRRQKNHKKNRFWSESKKFFPKRQFLDV